MQSEKCPIGSKAFLHVLSVSKASEAEKITKIDCSVCEIINKEGRIIAFATLVSDLYCLEVCRKTERINQAEKVGKKCGIAGMDWTIMHQKASAFVKHALEENTTALRSIAAKSIQQSCLNWSTPVFVEKLVRSH